MKPKLITNKLIANLKLCKNRHDNYLKYYKGKSFTKQQFMGLKNITHSDKVWISLKLVPKDSLRFIAADIAESVLDLYEKLYPNDLRPRRAIEAARSNSMSLEEKRSAADSAVDAANAAAYTNLYANNAVVYAANADAGAAYATAYATYTAYATAYDAVTYTDYVATAAANVATAAANVAASAVYAASSDNRKTQEKLIRKIILKYWK